MQVRFGIMADAHIDFMHDGEARVRSFLEACLDKKCDFCVDLGDFCPPGRRNAAAKARILSMLKSYPLPFYFVLGNHDMDENEKSAVRASLRCEDHPYSFDLGGVHFAFPDACYFREGEEEIGYAHGNYTKTSGVVPILPRAELERLRADLSAAKYPAVLFSHQSLIESRTGIKNPEAFRDAIKEAKSDVLLCACGHEHVDRLEKKDGTYYLCLNSMSYYWAGEKFDHEAYGKEIEAAHPFLRYVFPYRDPLFAIVEISDDGIRIEGRESEIVGALPEKMHFSKSGLVDPITASIQDRFLPF